MNDLDIRLRGLAEDLRADPILSASQIRQRGARRSTARRALATGTAALLAVGGVALAMSLRGTPPQPPASGPVPVWVERINADPQVFRQAPGGSGLIRGAATVEATLAASRGCLVFTPPPGSAVGEAPRVAVLPVGARWIPDSGGGIELAPDGDIIVLGTKMLVRVDLSDRRDDTFTSLCPGAAGYVTISAQDAIIDAVPPS